MADFFAALIDKVPELVKTPLGVLGLCILVGAYLLAFWKKARFDSLIARIDSLPERDRLEALKSEMGSVPIPSRFAPADWLMAQRQKYFFGAYLVTALLAALFIMSATLFAESDTNIDVKGNNNLIGVDSRIDTGN